MYYRFRAICHGRGERQRSGSGKLLDSEELKAMWKRSKLLSFCDMESFDLGVTQRSPRQAAMLLRDHVTSSLQDGSEMMHKSNG